MIKIKNFFGLVKIAVLERVKYKFNFFMTFFSSLLYSFLYMMLWKAIYHFKPDQVMDYQSLLTYVMIAQACNFSRWSPADRAPVYENARRIQSGDIVIDLLRPADYQYQKFCEACGFFIIEFIFVNIPMILFFIFVFHIDLPAGLTGSLSFFASLIVAFLTSFMLNQIVMTLTFWTHNAQGLQIAKKAIADLFAGTLIPFSFFPAWLKKTAGYMPFQAMSYIPVSIYTGSVKGKEIIFIFIKQIFWFFIMFVISRLLFKRLVKKLTVYGG